MTLEQDLREARDAWRKMWRAIYDALPGPLRRFMEGCAR